ncbi:hypothetical protein [Streptomyces sp. SAS_270]|uniref:hypothetical protein n=1 Tax=Streptomyces sp. SAS_270 TaxID=3412748 RepID=UPI00403C4AD2
MTRFDHRIVVLVSIKGLRTDCELFEEACVQNGWAILEQPAHPTGRELCVVQYTVEIRLPGTYGGAVRGARLQVEQVGRGRHLDLHVRATDRLEPDSRDRPLWYVYVDPPTAPPAFVPAWAWSCVRRTAVRLRLRDTGRQVRAESEAEALRLARRTLPGKAPAPPGIRVRSQKRNPERPQAMRWGNRAVWRRLIYLIVATAMGAAMLGYALNRESTAGTVLSIVTLVLVGAGFALVLLRRRWQNLEAWSKDDSGLVLMSTAGMLVCGFGVGMDGDGSDAWELPATALVFLLLRGLFLFIRQRSWRTWVPWVLPALLPFAFGAFPGVGSFVHLTYLDVFGVSLGDVGVPAYWQLFAALRWVAVVLVLLIGPALYGYIRHMHWSVEDRTLFGISLMALLIVAALIAGQAVVIGPAHDAGIAARRAAARGGTPAPYYGIEPQWVCASPLADTKPGEIPVQGGEFSPTRPYLMLGDSDGTVVLWEPGPKNAPDQGHALKLPLARLRIAPTTTPFALCT